MISIACTNCKTVLQIDDAFAGGVCRCQHCGTIQTVPSRLKGESAGGADPRATKTLYRNKPKRASAGALDQIADAVTSSGALAGSGLRTSARGATPPPEAPALPQARRRIHLIAGAVGAVVLLAVAWMLIGGGKTPSANPDQPGGAPVFAGVPLEGDTIVYLIDRGGANQGTFGDVVEATFNSLASLGPNRKFQIIFWNNGEDRSYPADRPTYANVQNILSARRSLEEVSAYGASDVRSAIKKAAGALPDRIVLTTAKGADLGDDFVIAVTDALKGTSAKVVAFSIGGESKSLQSLAEATGGSYHTLGVSQLRAIGR